MAINDTERKRKLDRIYREIHPDYKGEINGRNSYMPYAKYGGGLRYLDEMSDEELTERWREVQEIERRKKQQAYYR